MGFNSAFKGLNKGVVGRTVVRWIYCSKIELRTAYSCLILPCYVVLSSCGHYSSYTCHCWLTVVSCFSPCVKQILKCFYLLRRAFVCNSATTVLST